MKLDSIFNIIERYNRTFIFEISIHSENLGDESINCKLSNERANAIRNYLLKKGIKPDQLIAQGYGSLYPIADNRTPEGRAKNRRIEINLLIKKLVENME